MRAREWILKDYVGAYNKNNFVLGSNFSNIKILTMEVVRWRWAMLKWANLVFHCLTALNSEFLTSVSWTLGNPLQMKFLFICIFLGGGRNSSLSTPSESSSWPKKAGWGWWLGTTAVQNWIIPDTWEFFSVTFFCSIVLKMCCCS